jgi:isopentenyl-diphosphate delta-isomerase
MDDKAIVVVDENNNVIGTEPSVRSAVEKGLYRRTSSVFLFSATGKILIQKRSDIISFGPGLWDKAAGGHVDEGETYLEAAQRELAEELGITTDLTEVIGATKIEGIDGFMFETVYVGCVPEDVVITVDPEEVAETVWFSLQWFETDIQVHPEKYMPGLVFVWNQYGDSIRRQICQK